MRKVLKIKITENDLRNGIREDCFQCPIALAVNRELGLEAHKMAVEVEDADSIVINGHVYVANSLEMKNQVNNFIEGFDDGRLTSDAMISPIEITIEHLDDCNFCFPNLETD